jgi:hypothetical protein
MVGPQLQEVAIEIGLHLLRGLSSRLGEDDQVLAADLADRLLQVRMRSVLIGRLPERDSFLVVTLDQKARESVDPELRLSGGSIRTVRPAAHRQARNHDSRRPEHHSVRRTLVRWGRDGRPGIRLRRRRGVRARASVRRGTHSRASIGRAGVQAWIGLGAGVDAWMGLARTTAGSASGQVVRRIPARGVSRSDHERRQELSARRIRGCLPSWCLSRSSGHGTSPPSGWHPTPGARAQDT